jgi:hypothetical protein
MWRVGVEREPTCSGLVSMVPYTWLLVRPAAAVPLKMAGPDTVGKKNLYASRRVAAGRSSTPTPGATSTASSAGAPNGAAGGRVLAGVGQRRPRLWPAAPSCLGPLPLGRSPSPPPMTTLLAQALSDPSDFSHTPATNPRPRRDLPHRCRAQSSTAPPTRHLNQPPHRTRLTLDRSPPALRSTRNRPRGAMRRSRCGSNALKHPTNRLVGASGAAVG